MDWVNGKVRVRRALVCGQIKSPKTEAGERDVLLLPAALAALQSQKEYTLQADFRVFHYPHWNKPWANYQQICKGAWKPLLKKAGVRYRYPYQTRHTYASMLLSAGENMLWVANQMGHVNTGQPTRLQSSW